jgi:hypothetical protein
MPSDVHVTGPGLLIGVGKYETLDLGCQSDSQSEARTAVALFQSESMIDPTTGLAAASSAVSIIKSIAGIAKDSKDIELTQKIIQLQQSILEMQGTIAELQAENNQLQAKLNGKSNDDEIASSLRFAGELYYRKIDGKEYPHCAVCWNVDRHLVPLVATSIGKHCPIHEKYFSDCDGS